MSGGTAAGARGGREGLGGMLARPAAAGRGRACWTRLGWMTASLNEVADGSAEAIQVRGPAALPVGVPGGGGGRGRGRERAGLCQRPARVHGGRNVAGRGSQRQLRR